MATKKAKKGKRAAGGPRKIKATNKPKAVIATEAIDQPTPEQARRVEYERRELKDDMGRKLATTYRRRPLFETMATRDPGMMTPVELAALRYYRLAHERCDRSPTKSCLNVALGGASGTSAFSEVAHATPAILDARKRVANCEAVMGTNVSVMRDVVLLDRSFSEIAIDKFGSREEGGRVLPRSGRHRAIVRDQFLAGVRALAQRVEATVAMAGSIEIWVEVEARGARIVLGRCAPHRRYRLWGSYDAVSNVRFLLDQRFGRDFLFATADEARSMLDWANGVSNHGRLRALEDEELAA